MLIHRVVNRAMAFTTIMLAALTTLATAGASATAPATAVPAQAAVTDAYLTSAAPTAAGAHQAAQSPSAKAVPDITQATCTASRVHWVHVDFRGKNECYGFTGTELFKNGAEMYGFCAGNNHGSIIYERGGHLYFLPFGSGYRADYANGLYLLNLTITGWSGSGGC
jgi:hypothetical protein